MKRLLAITPTPADLGARLREAEANSPALRAATARLEAPRHVSSQAEAPPDPEASIAYTNVGVSRFTLGEDDFFCCYESGLLSAFADGRRRGQTFMNYSGLTMGDSSGSDQAAGHLAAAADSWEGDL